jgi:hypothetical protein
MTFKPKIWYPISAILSAINLGAVWFAAIPAEPMHATTHAVLALAFGLWAFRLRQRTVGDDRDQEIDALDGEIDQLRMELAEAQEKLDFAERMLAQGPDASRADPLRREPPR